MRNSMFLSHNGPGAVKIFKGILTADFVHLKAGWYWFIGKKLKWSFHPFLVKCL